MNDFVKHQTRFSSRQAQSISFLHSHATSKARFGSRLLASCHRRPRSLSCQKSMPYFSESAPFFSLRRQTTRSACHYHYHTRCRRRRFGLHVEEPIISDEENQSAFPRRRRADRRLSACLFNVQPPHREMFLDFTYHNVSSISRKYGTAIKSIEVDVTILLSEISFMKEHKSGIPGSLIQRFKHKSAPRRWAAAKRF